MKHVRDLRKAFATLEGDAFTAWVNENKTWYSPKPKAGKTKTVSTGKSEDETSSDEEDEPDKAEPKDKESGPATAARDVRTPKKLRPNLNITQLISKDLVQHVRWSGHVFRDYALAKMKVAAADIKQMNIIVNRKVTGVTAFGCMYVLNCVCEPRRACSCRHATNHPEFLWEALSHPWLCLC